MHRASGTASAPRTPARCPCRRGTLVNVTPARHASASTLISVWETTVPATTGSMRRVEPLSRRVSTSTRVGSPMRPGKTAEAITPIIVARTTGVSPIGVSGSAARSVSCQAIARRSSDRPINANASTIHPGVAVIRAWPMRCRPRRERANASTPPRRTTAARTPTRPQGVLRCRGGFCGMPIARVYQSTGRSGERARAPGDVCGGEYCGGMPEGAAATARATDVER
jgi:hypothetical protein